MKSATVIIPTTGSKTLDQAIASVESQMYPSVKCWVIIDGPEYVAPSLAITQNHPNVSVMAVPENTGANGFYGHRIYAASSFLINTDYVLFLDQDNWMQPEHVATLIDNCERKNLDWSYSLRSIYDRDGNYLLDDNCESLGQWPIFLSEQHHLVDTSCYCVRRETITRVGGAWYAGWGGDRQFYQTISQYFPRFGTTGRHSLCYRLDGNTGSVNRDFFEQGNQIMSKKYSGIFPWHQKD